MTDPAAAAEPTQAPVPETLHGSPVSYSRGQRVVHVGRDGFVALIAQLKADGFAQCVDLCAADYLGAATSRVLPAGIVAERYEVVVNLLSFVKRERVRVRVQVPAESPTIASLYDLHPGTEAMEREAYDLFGIWFEGHPDMSRILLPDEWEGHPLRKDYAVGRIPVQFTEGGRR